MSEDPLQLAVPLYIKELRKKRRWTQPQLAEAAGVSTTAIHNLEAGKNGFTDKTLAALANAFGCDPADLLIPHREAKKVSGERAVKELLSNIEGLPEDAINPLWRMVRGFLEDAASQQQTDPHDQSEPATRHREGQPSR